LLIRRQRQMCIRDRFRERSAGKTRGFKEFPRG
jgi:hypothetical protein